MNETRSIILLAALRLFLQGGYREVTMKDILEASGQAKGTFYYHFKDKESLFEEAAKYFLTNYIIINFHSLPYSSVKEFINAYLKVKEETAIKMSELGENVKLLIFLGQATMRLKSLELLMQQQEKKEREAWLTVLKNGREKQEIKTEISDENIINLLIHTYHGIRSEQFKSFHNNMDALTNIRQDWESIYALITK